MSIRKAQNIILKNSVLITAKLEEAEKKKV